MQPRLQAWRGVFAGHEAPHIFARCSPCFAAGKFLPAKKIAKNILFFLKFSILYVITKLKKQGEKNSEKKNLINSARGDDGNSDDACNGGQ